MKIFRFMSKEEFDKLLAGETLVNNKNHKANTNSIGFCFMKDDPEYCYEFLSGIVSDEVCVVFETKKELNKSFGIYADPSGSFFDNIAKDEYCTEEYSLEDFKIVKMCIPRKFKWYKNIEEFKQVLENIQKEKEESKKLYELKEKKRDEVNDKKLNELIGFLESRRFGEPLYIGDDNKEFKCKHVQIESFEQDFSGVEINLKIII